MRGRPRGFFPSEAPQKTAILVGFVVVVPLGRGVEVAIVCCGDGTCVVTRWCMVYEVVSGFVEDLVGVWCCEKFPGVLILFWN